MGAKTGPETDHLTFLREAASEASHYGFFALLRQAETRSRTLPRIGRSRLPHEDVATLAHAASMDFPAATLESIEVEDGKRPKIRSRFLGLTGPMGALPLHLTEYAVYERRYAKHQPFGGFLDLLTGRMLQFFYRAWADSQPAAQADRPEDDQFARYVAAVTSAGDGAPDGTSALTPSMRLHVAGLFLSRRSAAALTDGLSGLLGLPVTVQEFVGRWRSILPEDQTSLTAGGGYAGLGAGACLGPRVRIADDAFRVRVRTTDMAQYESLLPSGARFAVAAEALTALSPPHLEWELELEIEEGQAAPACLSRGARLGWSSWMAPRRGSSYRADARLRRESAAVGVKRGLN